jgi:hypothetical protein
MPDFENIYGIYTECCRWLHLAWQKYALRLFTEKKGAAFAAPCKTLLVVV